MERWWFNSMVFKKELERRYGIKKSTDSLGPIENTSESEDPSRKGRAKNIPSSKGRDNSSYSNIDHLFGVKDILNFISGETFLVRDSNGDSYSIYFDIENHIFEIDSEDSLYNCYMYDTQSSWNNHITSCIDSYLQSQIGIDTSIGGDSSDTGGDSSESYISRCIFEKRRTSSESGRSNIRNRAKSSDLTLKERSNDLDERDLDERSNDLDERDLDERSNDLDERDLNERDLTERDLDERSNDLDERSNDLDERSNDPYDESNSLWVLCENPDCHTLNYKKFLKSQMHTCEKCGYHFKMNSSDRIESLIDPGTWDPMDEDMVSIDPIEWDSESNSEFDEDPDLHFEPELLAKLGAIFGFEEIAELNNTWEDTFFPVKSDSELNENDTWEDAFFPVKSDSELNENDTLSLVVKSDSELDSEEDTYKERLDSYQRKTGLNEAVQTGVGQLNGIRVAIGFMDFEFIGGSMGSVVGEKIARLIEYATNQFLPLIIVCASGGARMQEGSLSLMQMAKIASALYDYQSNKKLFYVSILTSPTTGGVTASFGMLGDIIIAEPDSYIAFAGQRVIEQTLNEIVPEGSQETEYLFEKGLFDLVVPRNLLKDVLSELLKLHFFFPLNYTPIK